MFMIGTRPGSGATRDVLCRGLVLLPGLMLLLALVVGAAHHHGHESDSRACATCSMSHAQATVAPAVTPSAPILRFERVVVSRIESLHTLRLTAARSRAPPTA